jgi:hypothetical protein
VRLATGEGDIAEERPSGRGGTGPRPGEGGRADQRAFDADRVAGAGGRGERIGDGESGRLDRRPEHAVLATDGARQVFHPRAACGGPAEVGGAHIREWAARDGGRVEPDAEGERDEDRQLRRRVVPVHIGGGVGLGKPAGLRVGEASA